LPNAALHVGANLSQYVQASSVLTIPIQAENIFVTESTHAILWLYCIYLQKTRFGGGLVKMPDGSFELRTPRYNPTALLPAVWASKDTGPCAIALFKNYQDHMDEILSKVFYGVTAQVSHLL
jgi:hypothetical protein